MRTVLLSLLLSTALLSCGATTPEPFAATSELTPAQDPFPPKEKVTPIEVIPFKGEDPTLSVKQEMTMLAISPTGRVNRFGNPILKVEMIADNKLVDTVYAVSGRAHTQNKNRNQSGTQAPLPNGRYSIASAPVRGTSKEVGKLFLPITPLFNTGRFALGFHVDPSFDKDPIEDGTEGCVATTTIEERDRLFRFVQQHRPKYLQVQI